MGNSIRRRAMIALALCLTLASCAVGSIGGDEVGGAVDFNLRLGSYDIARVDYRVTATAGAVVREGSIRLDSDIEGAFRAVIGGIPVGGPYTMSLEAFSPSAAASESGATCSGSAAFTIPSAGARVYSFVLLTCGESDGEIHVDAALTGCPVIERLSALPTTLGSGESSRLSVRALNGESYRWTSATGEFSAPAESDTDYVCTSIGRQVITIEVDNARCPAPETLEFEIDCLPDTPDGGVDQADGSSQSGSDIVDVDAGT